eukprot:15455230-Alexandrium_andersonii.AAC.1
MLERRECVRGACSINYAGRETASEPAPELPQACLPRCCSRRCRICRRNRQACAPEVLLGGFRRG